jgi:hypothetical protein
MRIACEIGCKPSPKRNDGGKKKSVEDKKRNAENKRKKSPGRSIFGSNNAKSSKACCKKAYEQAYRPSGCPCFS